MLKKRIKTNTFFVILPLLLGFFCYMSSARFALVYYHPYFSLHVMRHSVVCLPQLQSTVPVVGIASEHALVVSVALLSDVSFGYEGVELNRIS